MKGVFDARKSLSVLQKEWVGCKDCSLGEVREHLAENQVFGGGTGGKNGILFLGASPGREEEREIRPIGGKPGRFLAMMLDRYRIRNFYVTNLVACRSCALLLYDSGQPRMSKAYPNRPSAPIYKDQAPLKPQTDACAAHVYEEIYNYDPILIVTLGPVAAATLRGNSFNLNKDRGYAEPVEIPGAGMNAVLSPKRKEWIRKVHGVTVQPVARSTVRYLMLPTLHPAEVREKLNDLSTNNPFDKFSRDLNKAKHIFEMYNEELYGHVPDDMSDLANTPYDIADSFNAEDEDERNG